MPETPPVIAPRPDYVKLTEAYGGAGERAETTATLGPALERGLQTVASGRTFLLDVRVKP